MNQAEKKRGDFLLHILHNFLSISSLKALVCRMCRVCFPWTRGCGTRQKRKRRKKTQSWRERERERCFSFLSNCNIERWIYYPENLTDFFFFSSRSSRNTELPLRPEYLDRAAVTQSDVESGGKKESGLCCKVHQSLFLSCILPNWCSCETADGGVGAEVRLWVEILGFLKRFPNLHPLK